MLGRRVTFLLLAVTPVTAVAVGLFTRPQLVRLVIPFELARMEAHAAALASDLQSYEGRARETVLALSAMPATGSALPGPGSSSAAEGRLALIFESELRARPWLLQLRLIGADGRELVGVDRRPNDGSIYRVPEGELQENGDRPDVRIALASRPGTAGVSALRPNQEFGQVALPIGPVFRTTATVADGRGIAGLVVATVDARAILGTLNSTLFPSSRVYVVTGEGDFIHHPTDSSLVFPGGGARPAGRPAWPEALGVPAGAQGRVPAGGIMIDRPTGAIGMVSAPTDLAPGVRIVETALRGEMVGVVAEGAAIWISLVGAAGALATGLLVALWVARPLDRPVVAAGSLRGPEDLGGLLARPGEFTDLNQAITELTSDVRGKTLELRHEGEERARLAAELDVRLERERTYLAVIEWSVDAIITATSGGIISSWNQAAEMLYGYTAAEAIGQGVEILIPPSRLAEVGAVRRRVLAGERIAHHETQRLHRSGRLVDVAMTILPIRAADGAMVGIASIAHDITGRKEAEERFRLVVEQCPSGVCVVGPDGRIQLVNDEMGRLFGYRREELVGSLVDLLLPERFRGAHSHLRKAFVEAPGGRPMRAGREVSAIRSDGFEFPVEIALSTIRTRGVASTLCLVADISERREANRKTAAYAAQLERSNADLERFAHVVSHDLKAPLRGIATVAEWLERDFGPVVDDDARENIQLMRERVERLSGLITGILDYSRAGNGRAEPAWIGVTALLEDIVVSIEPPPGIAIQLHQPLPDVRYDATQLRQVFQNLIVNAIAHGGAGLRRVTVSAEQDGKAIRFSVEDDGVGIAERHFERIFELFQTLRTDPQNRSSGAGLAIVKRIVEDNGGTISVASPEGQGSRFTFSIPIRPEAAGVEARAG